MKPQIIAIDGTAASGKSTLGCTLAQRHNYLYLDTGVMYRAMTWYTLNTRTDPKDEDAVSALAEKMDLAILTPTQADKRQATILVDQEDITWKIRSPEVDANVSIISSYAKVREIMTERQREIARSGPVVMVGRDIGTVVLPNADLKVFIEASVEIRAQRRYEECIKRGEEAVYEDILNAMIQRDKLDRERPLSPMVPAKEALIILTDNLSKEAVLQQVETYMQVPDQV